MLTSRCLQKLSSAKNFTVWRKATKLSAIPVETLLDLIGPANESIGLRIMQPGQSRPATPNAAMAAWAEGASLQLREAQWVWEDAALVAEHIGKAMDRETQGVSAIWSHANRRAAAPHRDPIDIVVLQLLGEKRWSCLGADGSVKKRVTLRAGDVLFVHAGERHVCDPLTDCMHVAVRLKRQAPR